MPGSLFQHKNNSITKGRRIMKKILPVTAIIVSVVAIGFSAFIATEIICCEKL